MLQRKEAEQDMALKRASTRRAWTAHDEHPCLELQEQMRQLHVEVSGWQSQPDASELCNGAVSWQMRSEMESVQKSNFQLEGAEAKAEQRVAFLMQELHLSQQSKSLATEQRVEIRVQQQQLEKSNAELRHEVDCLTEARSRCEEAESLMRFQQHETQRETDQLRAERDELNAMLLSSTKLLEDVRAELEHAQQQRHELLQQCRRYGAQKLEANEQHAMLRSDVQQVEFEEAKMQQEASTCKAHSAHHEQLCLEQQKQIHQLELQVGGCQARQEASESRNVAVHLQMESLQESNFQLEGAEAKAEQRIAFLMQELHLSQQSKSLATEQHVEIRVQQQQLEKSNAELRHEVVCLTEARSRCEEAESLMRFQQHETQGEADRLRAERDELTAMRLSSTKLLEDVRAELEHAQQQRHELLQQCRRYGAQKLEADEQHAMLRSDVQQVEFEEAKMQQEASTCRAHSAHHEQLCLEQQKQIHQLELQVGGCQARQEASESRNVAVHLQMESLQESNFQLEGAEAKAEQRIAFLMQELHLSQQSKSLATEQHVEIRVQQQQLERSNAQMRQEVDCLTEARSRCEEAKSLMRFQQHETQGEADQLRAERDELTAMRLSSTKLLEDVRAELEHAQQQRHELLQQCRRYGAQKLEADEQHAMLRSDVQQVEFEEAKMQQEASTCRALSAHHEQLCLEQQKQIHQLELQVGGCQARQEASESRNVTVHLQLESLQETNFQLEGAEAKAEQRIAFLMQELHLSQQSKSLATEQHVEIRVQQQQLEKSNAEFRHEVDCLTEARSRCEEAESLMRFQQHETQGEADQLRAARDELNAMRLSSTKLLEDVRAELEHAQQQRHELLQQCRRYGAQKLEADEQHAMLRSDVQQVEFEEAKMQQEASTCRALSAHHEQLCLEQQKQIHQLELQVGGCQARQEASESRNVAVHLQMESLQESNFQLEGAEAKAEQRIAFLMQELHLSQQSKSLAVEQHVEIRVQQQQLEKSNAEFRHEVDCLTEARSRCEEAESLMRFQQHETQGEADRLRAERDELTAMRLSSTKLLEDVRAEMEHAQQQRHELLQQCRRYGAQKLEADEQHAMLRSDVQQVEFEEARMQQEASTCRALSAHHEQLCLEQQKQIHQLELQVGGCQARQEASESRNVAVHLQMESLQESNFQLEGAEAKAEQRIAFLMQELHLSQQSKSLATEQHVEIRVQQQQLEKSNAELRQEVVCLTEARSRCEEAESLMRCQQHETQGEADQLRAERDELNAMRLSTLKLLEDLRANSQRLESKLEHAQHERHGLLQQVRIHGVQRLEADEQHIMMRSCVQGLESEQQIAQEEAAKCRALVAHHEQLCLEQQKCFHQLQLRPMMKERLVDEPCKEPLEIGRMQQQARLEKKDVESEHDKCRAKLASLESQVHEVWCAFLELQLKYDDLVASQAQLQIEGQMLPEQKQETIFSLERKQLEDEVLQLRRSVAFMESSETAETRHCIWQSHGDLS